MGECMKIEVSGKNSYNIFLNRQYIKNVDLTSTEEIIDFIKRIIIKHKKKLNLMGFYKVKVFPQDKIGMFVEIDKLDELEFSNNLDLRIVVFSNDVFFYETSDYSLIEDFNEKRYFDGKFYCVVDDYFNDIFSKVEFGRFVYGKEVNNLLNKGKVL